ncbi:hypothetical protein VTN49DRAFT_6244 [Thermomyces lanuginosus]|uniref:uncharacterized protein n=1 Tax=Thermomyces lanuginosus TaxID=5541 RepID=UPI003743C323
MSNAPLPGGALPTSAYNNTGSSSFAGVPRRSSYASVVSGTASANSPARSGFLSHLLARHDPAAADATAGRDPSSSNVSPQYHASSTPTGLRHFPYLHAADVDMQLNQSSSNSWGRSSAAVTNGLPAYSRQYANISDYADWLSYSPLLANPSAAIIGTGTMGGPGAAAGVASDRQFLVPSYLKNSPYIARLEAAHRARQLASQREPATHPPSLSASSSHVNLHRMAPSHRGMTFDLIEREPPRDQEKLASLPSRWSDTDKCNGLDVLFDGLEARYMGAPHKNDHEAATVRADHPIPKQCGIYYYEVSILAKAAEGVFSVGFSQKKASVDRLPGWEHGSWGYHGDDGRLYSGDGQSQGRPYGPQFGINDTIGCGINFTKGYAFFTKNGVLLGHAFKEVALDGLYPSVGMKRYPNSHVRVNFGQQPFMFDIDGMVKQEKFALLSEIKDASTEQLQPPLDEATLMQELIAQFLAQDGYPESARAFAEEVRQEANTLKKEEPSLLRRYEPADDVDSTNRQKIRAAILEGDIDKALKYTNAFYPNVLQDNPHILFKLRCRKFLEMIRRSTEPAQPTKRSKASNGIHPVSDQEMDVDEPVQDGDGDGDAMDTEDTADSNLLTEAVQYGQQLRMDYPSDENGGDKKYLDDIFSLVAYSDPRKSVHGHHLEPSGRTTLAEELNSAILVSLGKSSTTALETVYAQTEALLNEITEDGGAAAFLNIQNDFLR